MAHATTEIRINEHGAETHESWLLIRANHYTSMGSMDGPSPGQRLFDSEIPHQHFIGVTITRCSRRRDLKHDYLHNEQILLEMDMSQAQWGAFVSSFGQGTGVPATLTFLTGQGHVPQAPAESRLEESHKEVLASGEEALAQISESFEQVMVAFEAGGKRALREALRDLGIRLQNAPKNMEFAARSLTEHAENVVTKARADIEGMALAAVERGQLTEPTSRPELEEGAQGAQG